jgi:uncharacterized protein (PEP-CTERM system associated)
VDGLPKAGTQAPLAGAFSVFLAVIFAPIAQATDWRFTPYVGAAATYTDNVNQSANNQQDAMILSVTPGFSLQSVGSRRVKASVNYSLTGVSRFSDVNSTDVYHNLGALGKAELIEDFLFIDGTASISQGLVSLFGSSADATTNNSNRATVGVYSLSPYIRKRFGSFATAEARYTTGGAFFGNNAASDSVNNAFNASLNSGPRFNDLFWGLDYSLRKADTNGAAGNATFERATATLGYALTRKLRIYGTYGEERNEFLSAQNINGSSYSVGFGWTPTRRTNIDASIGERYFGRTYSFSGSHRTRFTTWTLRYSEDVSDISQQFLQDSGRKYWVCSGQLFDTPDFNPPPSQTGCQGPIPGALVAQYYYSHGLPVSQLVALGYIDLAVANGIFVSKSLTGSVSWSRNKLGAGLSVFDIRRIYQIFAGLEDRTRGVTGTLSYQLGRHSSANTSLSLIRNTSLSPFVASRDDDTLSLTLGLNHRFAKDLSGALSFRHQQRNSNAVNSDYTENSLTASANLSF